MSPERRPDECATRARRGERFQRRLRGLEQRGRLDLALREGDAWSGSNTHRRSASLDSPSDRDHRPRLRWVSRSRTSTATATGMCSLAPTARARANRRRRRPGRPARRPELVPEPLRCDRILLDSPRRVPPQTGHVRRVRHQGHGRRRGNLPRSRRAATARRLTACCGSSRCAQNTQCRASREPWIAKRCRVPPNDAADRCPTHRGQPGMLSAVALVVAPPRSSRLRPAA